MSVTKKKKKIEKNLTPSFKVKKRRICCGRCSSDSQHRGFGQMPLDACGFLSSLSLISKRGEEFLGTDFLEEC